MFNSLLNLHFCYKCDIRTRVSILQLVDDLITAASKLMKTLSKRCSIKHVTCYITLNIELHFNM